MDSEDTLGKDMEDPQDPLLKKSQNSFIYKSYDCSNVYIEKLNKQKNKINLIFRRPEEVAKKKELNIPKINDFVEIKIIFDFQNLSNELNLEKVKEIINDLYNAIKNNEKKELLSLVIQNCVVNNFISIVSDNNKSLILNELIIGDELYNISPNLGIIFPKIKANKLVLKKFKINSKLQLSKFCQFIIDSECKELFLEDIYIELIIKKNEKDTDYNNLESYFTYHNGIILLNNQYTYIRSLTLRDCPLFVLSKDMFKLNKEIEGRNIDVDENSIINPSIITKFKIKDKKYDICFDLDSYKLSKEDDNENENNNNNINDNENEDYIKYLKYIFNIIVGFLDDNKKKEEEEDESDEDNDDEEEDDEDIGTIDRENLSKLTFKNFDITKYEYITNDQATMIKEENWILNNEEEKIRKKKWDDFEKELYNWKNDKLTNVKNIVFENCTNFFIQWILYFIKANENEDKNVNITKYGIYNYELLKLKKCGKDYIDLKNILSMNIRTLILFDTPLIIDHFNTDNKPHLDYFKKNNDKKSLGYADNLIITINTLDYSNKEFYLNTYKTMEILVELIQCNNFNNNLSFNKNALSMIMTFLVYREYYPKKDIYSDPEIDECGQDVMDKNILNQINKEKETNEDNFNDNYNECEKLTCVSKKIFFSNKILRDYVINEAFKLKFPENSEISIVDGAIKKQSENYEYQNYLQSKKQGNIHIKNNEIKILDTGNNIINIDKDYKLFFSINKIQTVTLKKVELSHYSNNVIKDLEGDTMINLIIFTEEEKKIITENNFHEPAIPNYNIDMKTLNEILFKKYLFEDVGAMFRFLMLKINDSASFDKKNIAKDFFENFHKIFKTFKENKIVVAFIVYNNIELKELFCILSVAKVISDKKSWIKEKINESNKIKEIELPNKNNIEKEIGNYFLKEKNEEEKEMYSEFNCYYESIEEENMRRNKKIKIDDYTYIIDCQFDEYNI